MPLASALSYVQGLLDGLPMPGGGNLACKITAPEIFNDPGIVPTCYLWPSPGREARDPRNAGTMPRNTGGIASTAGFKTIEHRFQILLLWSGPGTELLFYSMMDALMGCLRTSPSPQEYPDPDTGDVSQMVNIGEDMSYRMSVKPAPDQQFNQYEALIEAPLLEVLQA